MCSAIIEHPKGLKAAVPAHVRRRNQAYQLETKPVFVERPAGPCALRCRNAKTRQTSAGDPADTQTLCATSGFFLVEMRRDVVRVRRFVVTIKSGPPARTLRRLDENVRRRASSDGPLEAGAMSQQDRIADSDVDNRFGPAPGRDRRRRGARTAVVVWVALRRMENVEQRHPSPTIGPAALSQDCV